MRAGVLVEFAKVCMTQIGPSLGTAPAALAKGVLPTIRSNTPKPATIDALIDVANDQSLAPVLAAMRLITAIEGPILHRRELWRDMERTVREHLAHPEAGLAETAWTVRDRGRQGGRRVEYRTVSRTLLVKGLEFDHAVVLNADLHPAADLYVALTRASRTLTVLSADRRVKPVAD